MCVCVCVCMCVCVCVCVRVYQARNPKHNHWCVPTYAMGPNLGAEKQVANCSAFTPQFAILHDLALPRRCARTPPKSVSPPG